MRPILVIPGAALALLVLGGCGQRGDKADEGPPTTAAGADSFIQGVNDDQRRLLPPLNSAQWLQATYITDDSQLISSQMNEAYLGFTARNLEAAKRFNNIEGVSGDTARGLMLMKNVSAPPPSDAALQGELAKILAKMEANYGAGKWCRTPEDEKN